MHVSQKNLAQERHSTAAPAGIFIQTGHSSSSRGSDPFEFFNLVFGLS